MPTPIVLNVNGKPHTVEAAPDTPLLYVLRNELGLNGPQFGCGILFDDIDKWALG